MHLYYGAKNYQEFNDPYGVYFTPTPDEVAAHKPEYAAIFGIHDVVPGEPLQAWIDRRFFMGFGVNEAAAVQHHGIKSALCQRVVLQAQYRQGMTHAGWWPRIDLATYWQGKQLE